MVVICVLLTAVAGLAQQSHAHPPTTVDDPNWSALMASMEHMHMAMASVTPSGDNDVDFVTLMLPHHQAAIDMAKTQLANGTDPLMRRLAQEIVADQQSEIELMQLWLKQHGHGLSRQAQKPAFHEVK
jgi:uncharacterized protein (DUF305 family)